MKLTLSNSRQIVTMTLVWTTALFAVDYLKHPRPLAVLFGIKREGLAGAVRLTKPTIIFKSESPVLQRLPRRPADGASAADLGGQGRFR